jgi:hypothetical protein
VGIDTKWVILHNNVSREPRRVLQVVLLQGVPYAKGGMLSNFEPASGMAMQHLGSS